MKTFAFLSFIFLSLTSCTKKNEIYYITPPASLDTITIHKTYLALGDSYTIGQSVAVPDKFPVQAVQLLRQQNIAIADPDIVAVTGWTTGNLLDALNTAPPKNNYDIVTLLIGVNNQYQGRPLNEYKMEFTSLLKRAVTYAGNKKEHVFVLSIPDYSVTPFARYSDTAKIAREIDAFNAANKAITLSEGVTYIDITPISRDVKNDPSLVAGDGLHPSGAQYKKWVDLLVPLALKQLQ